MKNTHTYLLLAVVILMAASCRTTLPEAPLSKTSKITVAPGTEDLVLDESQDTPRLIVSCAPRRKDLKDAGGFFAVNLETGQVSALEMIGLPEGLQLAPHGIDLTYNNKGVPVLYVVNHQDIPDSKKHENSILVFQVQKEHLRYMDQYKAPELVSPNEVAALPDGSVYVTNDSKHAKMGFTWLMEKLFKMRSSKIAYRTPDGNWKIVGDKRLAYANGIQAFEDKVMIATTQKKELIVFKRDSQTGELTAQRNVGAINGLDNITVINDSLILSPSHPSQGKFLKHAKKAENPSPGITWLINLNNGHYRPIYVTDGTEISANSVSLYYDGKLYIGQVFEDFLLVVDTEGDITRLAP